MRKRKTWQFEEYQPFAGHLLGEVFDDMPIENFGLSGNLAVDEDLRIGHLTPKQLLRAVLDAKKSASDWLVKFREVLERTEFGKFPCAIKLIGIEEGWAVVFYELDPAGAKGLASVFSGNHFLRTALEEWMALRIGDIEFYMTARTFDPEELVGHDLAAAQEKERQLEDFYKRVRICPPPPEPTEFEYWYDGGEEIEYFAVFSEWVLTFEGIRLDVPVTEKWALVLKESE